MSNAEFGQFEVFVDETGERCHIHERTGGEERCVTQLDADLAAAWAVSLWRAQKEMEDET